MTAIRIRRATTADRDAVIEGRLAFLCEVRDLRRDELTDEFVNMHVVPDQRRLGIAQRLLDACLAAAPGLGIRRIDLHATDDGRPLYVRNGFTDVADWMQLRVDD